MYIIQTTDVTWVAEFSPEAYEICKILMEILTKKKRIIFLPKNDSKYFVAFCSFFPCSLTGIDNEKMLYHENLLHTYISLTF